MPCAPMMKPMWLFSAKVLQKLCSLLEFSPANRLAERICKKFDMEVAIY